jgi:hypothetical protein
MCRAKLRAMGVEGETPQYIAGKLALELYQLLSVTGRVYELRKGRWRARRGRETKSRD